LLTKSSINTEHVAKLPTFSRRQNIVRTTQFANDQQTLNWSLKGAVFMLMAIPKIRQHYS